MAENGKTFSSNTTRMMLAVVAVVVAVAVASQHVTVNTKYGPVVGNVHATVDEWLGVPYAAPPGLWSSQVDS